MFKPIGCRQVDWVKPSVPLVVAESAGSGVNAHTPNMDPLWGKGDFSAGRRATRVIRMHFGNFCIIGLSQY